MITLRDLIRTDRALAAITTEECHLIGSLIRFVSDLSRGRITRYFVPKKFRDQTLTLSLIAAIFDRTPLQEPSLQEAIKLEMMKGE